jgi:hypothetical protein
MLTLNPARRALFVVAVIGIVRRLRRGRTGTTWLPRPKHLHPS